MQAGQCAIAIMKIPTPIPSDPSTKSVYNAHPNFTVLPMSSQGEKDSDASRLVEAFCRRLYMCSTRTANVFAMFAKPT